MQNPHISNNTASQTYCSVRYENTPPEYYWLVVTPFSGIQIFWQTGKTTTLQTYLPLSLTLLQVSSKNVFRKTAGRAVWEALQTFLVKYKMSRNKLCFFSWHMQYNRVVMTWDKKINALIHNKLSMFWNPTILNEFHSLYSPLTLHFWILCKNLTCRYLQALISYNNIKYWHCITLYVFRRLRKWCYWSLNQSYLRLSFCPLQNSLSLSKLICNTLKPTHIRLSRTGKTQLSHQPLTCLVSVCSNCTSLLFWMQLTARSFKNIKEFMSFWNNM